METVLITGASSGIGMEYAKQFAARGYHLVLVARRENILNELAASLRKEHGIPCDVIAADLSEKDAAKRIFEITNERNLQIDVLINNAGFATKGMLEWADYEKQHNEIEVNITALVELTYFFIAPMAARKHGMVINVGSAASFNPVPYNSVYSATKAFVLSFTQGIEYEYRNQGVKVMVVCPQATDTHFFDQFNKMNGKMRSTEQVVHTTFRAMKRGKVIAKDGTLCKVQSWMHHVMSRSMRVRITGKIAKNIWGKKM